MRRDIFVFAGQSNMMGASVYPPKKAIHIKNSYEYKHKERRLGKQNGKFVRAGYPVGEFSYADLNEAYSREMVNNEGKSLLKDYVKNTYFCPSMSSLKSDNDKTEYSFSTFSEADAPLGATLAPFVAEEWEKLGYSCAYSHIAKGGVAFAYYFTDDMAEEYTRRISLYNKINGTCYATSLSPEERMSGAADYFFEKCKDFFDDTEKNFSDDDISSRCLFWLQGESDACYSSVEYEIKLEIFWERLKQIGFTYFFCIRVDFFGNPDIDQVMLAQERFVSRHIDTHILTRAASYFLYANRDEDEWFCGKPGQEYRNCRDSFFGFENQHINEKGFCIIAEHAVKNLYRILIKGQEALLEDENIRLLLTK